jgi:hypothetical protein
MKKIFTLLFIAFSLSSIAQSGITWTATMNIASNTYSNMHPRIALDGMGNPLVIWGRMSDDAVFFTRWNGSAFTTPVKLNGTLTIASSSWMGPQIASKGDTVYVVMKRMPEADTANHLYIVRSFNGGMTFSAPMQMESLIDHVSRFPTVTVDETGNPIVAFMKFESDFSGARWVVMRSSDYGMTFTTDVLASGWSGGGGVCDCCPGGITNSGNTVAMLYRDAYMDIRDSWVGLSTDGGLSFTDGWNVDGNNWNLGSCPSSGPDGIIIGDSLYSVFMNGSSGMNLVYRSTSSISSAIAPASVPMTGTIMNLNMQNYPRIANYGTAAAIVWKQQVNFIDVLPILFTNDIANGFPAAYDTVDLTNITNADVAIGNGNVFVIWEDDNSQTVKYRKGTYNVVTSVNELNKNRFTVFPNPVQNILTIQSAKPVDVVRILNVLGEIKKEIKAGQGKETMSIDISDLAAGIYFIEAKSVNALYKRRFIKAD